MILTIAGWAAPIFVFLSFFMKTMIPLRIMAIVSNILFLAFALAGIAEGKMELLSILTLHASLLPLNIMRLYQMKSLIEKVHEASNGHESPNEHEFIDLLIPYMMRETLTSGHILFRKGDKADKIYFIQKGGIRLPELNKKLPAGTVLGEVGVFAPGNTRAVGAVCEEDCVVFSIHRDKVVELYYQNPKFGFLIVKSVSRIVSENTEAFISLRSVVHAPDESVDVVASRIQRGMRQ